MNTVNMKAAAGRAPAGSERKRAAGFEAVVPNPKLKLMDQVREVNRTKRRIQSQ